MGNTGFALAVQLACRAVAYSLVGGADEVAGFRLLKQAGDAGQFDEVLGDLFGDFGLAGVEHRPDRDRYARATERLV